MKFTFFGFLSLLIFMMIADSAFAQNGLAPLTVEKIMRQPNWIGTSPNRAFWSVDGKNLYFYWNPNKNPSDSLYKISLSQKTPVKVSLAERKNIIAANDVVFNTSHKAYVYEKNGDIFYTDLVKNQTVAITQTMAIESDPYFSFYNKKVVYKKDQNLFAWSIANGSTQQLTNFSNEKEKDNKTPKSLQNQWLQKDQLREFEVLQERKKARDDSRAAIALRPKNELRKIPLNNHQLLGLQISGDGRFISYRLRAQVNQTGTVVPNYVTESGYTEMINSRPKVGETLAKEDFYIWDCQRDCIYKIALDNVAGITDIPEFIKDYPQQYKKLTEKPEHRAVNFYAFKWAPNHQYAVLEMSAQDNKDRWLLLWDTATHQLSLLDRQHNDAWIGGPGINSRSTGWINNQQFWYQSEVTGYSHIYVVNVTTKEKKALTQGNFEVRETNLSANKKYFYFITNIMHPGVKQFYRLQIANEKLEQLTHDEGAYEVFLSPNEKNMAFLYSYINQPAELFLQANQSTAKPEQLTFLAKSKEFSSYAWRIPEVIKFKATDGKMVYARIYKPAKAVKNAPAVLFVHGAGYLQNAHKWWSSYFREYMFNNLLADKGYYVMDIDYRGSAGYGSEWRTGIYRNMGGKDLSDQVDAVNYLKENYLIDENKVGLYGGSYGGFITLMALFKNAETFTAGAALRPVTDWAQYNHGYTSNILNEPYNDSIAYKRSSPIYYANGLQGNLLICHGILDVNVHYQDAVKLSQRLIELGKNNWQLMGYPMEDHGFVEPSSWTDEYKRILKLFEDSFK